MTALPPNDNQQNTEQTKVVCHYCKKPGHVIRDCRKSMRKEQEQRNDHSYQNIKLSTSKSFAPCPHCQRTNRPPEKCCSGPNAANKPKRFKHEYSADNRNDGQEQGNLTPSGPSSILRYLFKLKEPLHQWADYTSVRQYVISDPPTIVYHSHQTSNTGILLICPTLSSTQYNEHMVQISNFHDHPYTLKKGTHIANFSILTPEQTKHIRPVNPTSVRHLLNNSHDDAIHYINSLLKSSKIDKVN